MCIVSYSFNNTKRQAGKRYRVGSTGSKFISLFRGGGFGGRRTQETKMYQGQARQAQNRSGMINTPNQVEEASGGESENKEAII